ncbi:unnamed protein product, partial [Tilletia controversa]
MVSYRGRAGAIIITTTGAAVAGAGSGQQQAIVSGSGRWNIGMAGAGTVVLPGDASGGGRGGSSGAAASSSAATQGDYALQTLPRMERGSSRLDASEESGARLSPGATQFSLARFVAWDFWPFWQGLVFTGMAASGSRVVAHECGHQALSPSKTINNAVDWVLHSALMVPHHS